MVATAGTYSNATGLTYLDKVMLDEAAENTWPWPKLYGKIKSTTEHEMKRLQTARLGYPIARGPLGNIQSEDMGEIGTLTRTAVEFALGHDIDLNLFEDLRAKGLKGKSDYMKELGLAFGESYKALKNKQAALPLNRAFSTTNQKMYDTYALCTESATLQDGTSIINALDPASVTTDAMWDMSLFLMNDQYTYKGLHKSCVPKIFIYHPIHEKEAKLIKTNKWEPGEGNRDRNTINDYGIDYVPCIELDDTDAMFMMGKEALKNIDFYSLRKLKTKRHENPRNNSMSVLTSCRWIVSFWKRDHIVGIPGS